MLYYLLGMETEDAQKKGEREKRRAGGLVGQSSTNLLGMTSIRLWAWAFTSLLFIYIAHEAALYTIDALSPQGCRMSWMYPEYVLQHSFNTSWTPLANRYSLWLYREGDGWETDRKVIPSF